MKFSEINVPSTKNIVEIILEDKDGNIVESVTQENAYTYKAWEYFFSGKQYGWGYSGGLCDISGGIKYIILEQSLWISGGDASTLGFMNIVHPSPSMKTSGGNVSVDIGYEYGGNKYIKNSKTYSFQHGAVNMDITCIGLGSNDVHSYLILRDTLSVTREHRLIVKYSTLFRDDQYINLENGTVNFTEKNRFKIGEGVMELENKDHAFSVYSSKYIKYGNVICGMAFGNRGGNTSGSYSGTIISDNGDRTSLSGQWSNITPTISPNKRNYTFGSRFVIPPTHPKIVNAKTILFNYQGGGNQYEVVFDEPFSTEGDIQITFDLGFTLVANQEEG